MTKNGFWGGMIIYLILGGMLVTGLSIMGVKFPNINIEGVGNMLGQVLVYVGWFFAIVIPLWIISMGIRIIRPMEKGVIERFGKFRNVASQGFHLIIPVVDKMYKVNLTEKMMDVEPQEIITEDNLNAKVDLVVYYQVRSEDESVKKSLYNVQDFEAQIIKLAQTTARNVIGTMPFKDVNSQRNKLNVALAEVLDKESDAWGVKIVRVEMKEITPPQDVQDTMNKVLKAENEKRSAVDFATAAETQADGERRASIKNAEGTKQAWILEAEGKKQSQILIAQGQAEAFNLINKSFIDNAQVLKKLETIQASLENNTKYVIDPNTNITNIITEKMAGVVPIPPKRETVSEPPFADILNSAIPPTTSRSRKLRVRE